MSHFGMPSSTRPRPPSRRRLILPICICLTALFLLFFWRHILALSRILPVYALWPVFSAGTALSLDSDGFDTTFARYPVRQWTARMWPPSELEDTYGLGDERDLMRLADGRFASPTNASVVGEEAEDLVPPVLHHILLGMPRKQMPEAWEATRESCLEMHPESANYTHNFWDDEKALQFVSDKYPWFLRHWLSYQFPIQRADSLRYLVLHHYGGIFLDMDLQCLRSLGPLRKFPIVNIGAFPVGVSNGFMMAQKGHPFLQQLVRSLRLYNRSYFGIPYINIMFSTGPMFLSSEHMRYPYERRSHDLRILASPSHRLNGRVTTPLFRHLGASSWHRDDARLLRAVARGLRHPLVLGLLVLAGAAGYASAVSLREYFRVQQRGESPRSPRWTVGVAREWRGLWVWRLTLQASSSLGLGRGLGRIGSSTGYMRLPEGDDATNLELALFDDEGSLLSGEDDESGDDGDLGREQKKNIVPKAARRTSALVEALDGDDKKVIGIVVERRNE